MKHTIKTSQLTLTEPYHVLHGFCNSPPHEIRRLVAIFLIKKMNVICLDASFKRSKANIPFSSYVCCFRRHHCSNLIFLQLYLLPLFQLSSARARHSSSELTRRKQPVSLKEIL